MYLKIGYFFLDSIHIFLFAVHRHKAPTVFYSWKLTYLYDHPEVWQLSPDGLHLVQLYLCVHHHDVGPAGAGQVPGGLYPIGGVDPGSQPTCCYSSHSTDVPLWAVGGEDVHRVVRLRAQLDERLGHRLHLLLVQSAKRCSNYLEQIFFN